MWRSVRCSTHEREFAALDDHMVGDHPLLADAVRSSANSGRPFRGYAIAEEAPATTIVLEAFKAAGGSVAATIDGEVAVGSVGNVHVIGSLLPPSSQDHLYPFGVLDYSVSVLGHTVLSNTLGLRGPTRRGRIPVLRGETF